MTRYIAFTPLQIKRVGVHTQNEQAYYSYNLNGATKIIPTYNIASIDLIDDRVHVKTKDGKSYTIKPDYQKFPNHGPDKSLHFYIAQNTVAHLGVECSDGLRNCQYKSWEEFEKVGHPQ